MTKTNLMKLCAKPLKHFSNFQVSKIFRKGLNEGLQRPLLPQVTSSGFFHKLFASFQLDSLLDYNVLLDLMMKKRKSALWNLPLNVFFFLFRIRKPLNYLNKELGL